jgi:hypothetical protein
MGYTGSPGYNIFPMGQACMVCGQAANQVRYDACSGNVIDSRCAQHGFEHYSDQQHIDDLQQEIVWLRETLVRIRARTVLRENDSTTLSLHWIAQEVDAGLHSCKED